MPWHIAEHHSSCPMSEPFAVINETTGDVERGGCHATREEADKHMSALYANVDDATRAQMSAAAINDLPDSDFAYIEPGGHKDEQGKTVPRSLRHSPIHDAAHVRNALARGPQSPFWEKARPKIEAAARKFGIGRPAEQSRFEETFMGPQVFIRSYPLEDARILTRAQGSEYADGRTVEAYVAAFDRDTEIHDHEGHYLENVARTAFDKAINDARPQGSRTAWRVGVFYNHGLSIHGTPSDRFSLPLGSPVDIRAADHGVLTRTHYNETPLAEEVLELYRSGDITGHSFTGRIIKSDPARPPRRGYGRSADGSLQRVRRLELGLREYGPTPFPAYADTPLVGIRSVLLSATPHVFDDAVRADEIEEPVDSDTSSPEGAVTDEPPTSDVEHSSRSALLQRIAVAKRTRPGLGARPEGDPS